MTKKICIIGLGYVGLPLAHAFSKKYKVVGFDINKPRVDELNIGMNMKHLKLIYMILANLNIMF